MITHNATHNEVLYRTATNHPTLVSTY